MATLIPSSALPNVKMKRIHAHWTAGSYNPNAAYDMKAYHFLVSGDSRLVVGKPSIAKNSGRIQDGYSAHTLNANTDAISISCCCMAGASEAPFNPGRFPMKEDQFELMCEAMAELSHAYDIEIGPKTTLSHAEVQPNLGIAQRAKWDFTRLPFRADLVGAKAVGNYMRERITFYARFVGSAPINGDPVMPPSFDNNPIPEGALVEITAAVANFRSSPDGTIMSVLPRGVQLRVIGQSGNWLHLQTPMGYKGYISKELVIAIDGPAVEEPTKPDTTRLLISDIRKLLDKHEAELKG